MNWHHDRRRLLRYVGSKIRIVPEIAKRLQATGMDCLVDVFGGSGAVTMNSGFTKRVYNDADSSVVNFFRVIADPTARRWLFAKLRALPMSRELFYEMQLVHRAGSADVVTRAAALFYVSSFAYGGKVHHGGFAASTNEERGVKEINRYRNILRDLVKVGEFWKGTVIEQQDFEPLITSYGKRPGVVLYCDPPYFGTERYYEKEFSAGDHVRLATVLNASKSPAIVSYHATPEILQLYPEATGWRHVPLLATKNSMGRESSKEKVMETLICRGIDRPVDELELFAQRSDAGGHKKKTKHGS